MTLIFQELINEFYITVGLLLANLAVAILIAIQMKQTKKQFIDLNRPWLHLYVEKIREIKSEGAGWGDHTYYNYYPLILENSGKLTAKNIQISTNSDETAQAILHKNNFDSIRFEEFYPSTCDELNRLRKMFKD